MKTKRAKSERPPVAVNIRMDADLADVIKSIAARQLRSVSAQISIMLRDAVKDEVSHGSN